MASLLLGVGLGVLHDCHRLIRVVLGAQYGGKSVERLYAIRLPILKRPLRRPRQTRIRSALLTAVMLLQDALLFAAAGVGVAVLLYEFNHGRFRLLAVIAPCLGFASYYFTAGRLVMLLSEGIVFFLRASASIFFALLLRPIRFFCSFFGDFAKKIYKKSENAIAKKRKRVYNKNKIKQIMQRAEQGFLDGNV